jgi:hypothetical protein
MAIGISLPKASSNKIGVSVPKKVTTTKGKQSVAPKQMSVAPKTTSIPKVGPSSSYTAPNMSVAPKAPTMSTVNGPAVGAGLKPMIATAKPKPNPNRGGGGSNVFDALRVVGGGGDNQNQISADNGVSGGTVQNPFQNYNTTNVGGNPAIEKTTYMNTTPKGMNPSSIGGGNQQPYEDRAMNQQRIAQMEAQKQANINAIQGQIAALQSQITPEGEQTASIDLMDSSYTPDEDTDVKRYDNDLANLQRQLQEAEQDSPEVLEAKKQEQSLLAEEANIKAGLTGSIAAVKDQPIPFGFITGQQTALENRANAKLEGIAAKRIPLQQQLANLQAKKAAALDVVKTQLGISKDARTRSEGIYDKNYNRRNELQDAVLKQTQENRKQQIEKDSVERKFQEDVRRYGLEYALKQKQLMIDQQNADTNKYKAENSGLGNPFE